MPRSKIAITLDETTLRKLDRLVASKEFPNRSRAIEQALAEKLARVQRTRLARECAKVDPAEEQAMAEEFLPAELDVWPEY